ncbi:MAG TPA: hypothetical protein VM782_06605, partial [Stellaceae bacterium]|nr:hypothetical protein [Stellaceae bacterium]
MTRELFPSASRGRPTTNALPGWRHCRNDRSKGSFIQCHGSGAGPTAKDAPGGQREPHSEAQGRYLSRDQFLTFALLFSLIALF